MSLVDKRPYVRQSDVGQRQRGSLQTVHDPFDGCKRCNRRQARYVQEAGFYRSLSTLAGMGLLT